MQQQQHAATHQHALLLFLELTTNSASTSSLQLLQLSTSSSSMRGLVTAAAAMTASEAFTGTCFLLQASVNLPAQQLQQLVARAGAFLRNGYGWCDFSSAAYASAAAAADAGASAQQAAQAALAGSTTRPPSAHSMYDCFMQQLAFELLRGPHPRADGSLLMPAAVAAEPACDDEDAWEEWLETDGFKCVASLVVSYDRPQALVRGLHVLAQEQQRQAVAAATEATQPIQPPPAGASQRANQKAGSSKEASKAAMQRVMRLLGCVFLAAEEPGVACFHAAALGMQQLLLGLSELLRPSADCSVEWRVAALGLMRTALEQHAQRSHSVAGECPAEGAGAVSGPPALTHRRS
jgi:hypothetical protein